MREMGLMKLSLYGSLMQMLLLLAFSFLFFFPFFFANQETWSTGLLQHLACSFNLAVRLEYWRLRHMHTFAHTSTYPHVFISSSYTIISVTKVSSYTWKKLTSMGKWAEYLSASATCPRELTDVPTYHPNRYKISPKLINVWTTVQREQNFYHQRVSLLYTDKRHKENTQQKTSILRYGL